MGWIKSNLLVLVAAFVGVVLLAGIVWLLWSIGSGPAPGAAGSTTAGSEIILPIVILASVVALLIVLGLLTLLLSLLGLGTPNEALGLPSGSVRAVIALMLFVVFAIVAIYLFGIVIKVDTNAGVDLAKQLIVLIGTLVTAVASFYFGSSAVSSAQKDAEKAKAAAGGPNAEKVEQPILQISGTPQPLTVKGTNLGKVNAVKLEAGTEAIDAVNVVAKETEVTCEVSTKGKQPSGPWTVVVSDSSNNYSKVPNSITLK